MPSEPTILAFDTSAAHCAAALLMGGRIVAERLEEMGKGQAERLFPMLEEVLAEEGAVWEELDAIGVATGPGNFTGIRISVSAARGLTLSLGIPAVGVSGFEVVRHLLGGDTGRAVALLPAPRDQVYWQVSNEGRPEPARLAAAADFVCHHGYLDPPALITLDDASPVESYFVDGTRIDCDAQSAELRDMGVKMAGTVARLAARRLSDATQIPRPAPLYIRPADAAPASDPPPVILP